MTTDYTTDLSDHLSTYVDRILDELASLEVRKAALTMQLTSVRDKLKGFRTRKANANGSGRKVRKPRTRTMPSAPREQAFPGEQ